MIRERVIRERLDDLASTALEVVRDQDVVDSSPKRLPGESVREPKGADKAGHQVGHVGVVEIPAQHEKGVRLARRKVGRRLGERSALSKICWGQKVRVGDRQPA